MYYSMQLIEWDLGIAIRLLFMNQIELEFILVSCYFCSILDV